MEQLKDECIVLNLPGEHKDEVIKRCGALLVKGGYATERYVEGMLKRDAGFSCAIGNGIAIPHGEVEYKPEILATGFCVLTYPDGIDWAGQKVYLVIGIAARGEEHLDIIGNIVDYFDTEDDVHKFLTITAKDKIRNIFYGDASK
ncbi:MAG: PTS sugar transporter subunit IIA [Spirochaetaceae bacterium]|jgi:mannitol/fructose-specific phosphotransferase system IIA component|nr:PTS sugar transporter subunit IIA [Spirochaetaceae bacterium]